jgi:hypothetical protein
VASLQVRGCHDLPRPRCSNSPLSLGISDSSYQLLLISGVLFRKLCTIVSEPVSMSIRRTQISSNSICWCEPDEDIQLKTEVVAGELHTCMPVLDEASLYRHGLDALARIIASGRP